MFARRPSSFRLRSMLLVAGGLALVGLAPAISAGCASDGPECTRGGDCATGICNAAGRCVPVEEVDGAAVDASTPTADATSTTDGNVPPPDVAIPDGGCVANKDFRILREEIPLQAGLRATFKVARDVDAPIAGTPGPGDTRDWDFSGALASDALALVETQKVSDKWYKDDFKTATYATKLSESSTLLGVFEVSPSALKLLGVVSPEEGISRTNVGYSPAADILVFPLEQGKTWTTNATVSGLVSGFFSTYFEKYESSVDAKGTLKTEIGTFTVLRVRTLLTKTVGALVTTTRSFAWVSECYGTVATATSDSGEPNAEFTHAAEIRRISR